MNSIGAKRLIRFPSACHNGLYNSRRCFPAGSDGPALPSISLRRAFSNSVASTRSSFTRMGVPVSGFTTVPRYGPDCAREYECFQKNDSFALSRPTTQNEGPGQIFFQRARADSEFLLSRSSVSVV